MAKNLLVALIGIWLVGHSSLSSAVVDPKLVRGLNLNELANIKKDLSELKPQERLAATLDIMKATEKALIQNRWTYCKGPLIPSDNSPFRFQIFLKEENCFHSLVKNSIYWQESFVKASLDDQAVLVAAVLRLKRALH